MTEPIEQHGITSHEAIVAVREIIRRAILTFHALPDPQRHFHYQGSTWAGDYMDQYGKEFTPIHYTPTPYEVDQAVIVLPWLKYLGEVEGRKAVLRLLAWCHGATNTRQAKREGCSEKTLISRVNASVAKIIDRFFGVACTIEVVEEPYKETEFALAAHACGEDMSERAAAFGSYGPPRIMTVYVHRWGYMRNGRQWDNGHGMVDKILKQEKNSLTG